MNKPYVKRYDADGVLLNPITKNEPYLRVEENRKTRRRKEPRFINNRSSVSLIVFQTMKAVKRRVQKFDHLGRCVQNTCHINEK